MKVFVLGGAGKVGLPAIKLLATSDLVTGIAVAGRDVQRAEQAARDLDGMPVEAVAVQVDGADEQALASLLAGYDIILNAAATKVVLPAVRAAARSGVHYCDVATFGSAEDQALMLGPEAEAAGGRIINMNGNHEIMTAYGDYRYMQEWACGAFADLEGLDTSNPLFDELSDDCKLRAAAFWPGGPYAQIIADWPMVAVVQDTVFVHGGLHQKHLDYGIDEINEMTRAWLLGEGSLNYSQVGGGTDVKSVDWDRTYSDDEVPPSEEDCANLASVLEQLGVVRMAVGHTVWDHINPACDELVWRIDTGMAVYYGGEVEVFEVLDGEVNILTDLAG